MKNKKIIIIAVVVLLIALGAGIPIYWYNQNNYVAKVDGMKITKPEYEYYLKSLKAQVETEQQFADEAARTAFWQSISPDGVSWEEYVRNTALQYAKQTKILTAKAKENGVKLTTEEKDYIKSQIDSIIKDANFGGGKRIQADQNMKASYGITLSQYEGIMSNDMLVSKYLNQENTTLVGKVTDEEAQTYYNENPTEFDKVTVRHILFLTVDTASGAELTQDQKDAAKQKADATLIRVNAGENMETLVAELSEDPAASQNKGVYTFAQSESYEEAFKAWAFAAKVGDTGVVQSNSGYHVMRLDGRDVSTFDSVKDKIKSTIASKKLTNQVSEWEKDPKNDIKINDKVYKSIK